MSGLRLHAKHSGVGSCDRTATGSQTALAIWSSQRRVWHLLSLYVFGELASTFEALYPQSWALPTVEQWCSQQAGWLGVLRRSTVSQSARHTHFTFSTSITPHKSDMHKHGLITKGWPLPSNFKKARNNLKPDRKKFKCDTIS